MKKLFVCAAAAIVALASCSKTELINTEAPKEIGFKAVTGSITKALSSTALDINSSLGVFAYVHDDTEIKDYFGNTKFIFSSEEEIDDVNTPIWTSPTTTDDQDGVGPKYWPIAHNLDFVVYSPYQSSGVSYNLETSILSVTANNASIDYLYGDDYYDKSGNGYDKDTKSVPVQLNHAKAKITVNLTYENVTITNLQLDEQVIEGTYNVDYSTSKITWPTKSEATKVSFNLDNNGSGSILVVPETVSNISFNYTMEGTTTPLSYTIVNSTNWEAGYEYIFNINVTPKEIKFTPVVLNWDDTNDETVTL